MPANLTKRLIATFVLAGSVTCGALAADPPEKPVDEAIVNPFEGRDDLVPKGRTLFNIHCSHCHGPNAFQGERKRDLRRLSRRYREDINKVFLKTVLNGRPEKGMPPWKDIVEEEELWKIFTFLKTVQK